MEECDFASGMMAQQEAMHAEVDQHYGAEVDQHYEW